MTPPLVLQPTRRVPALLTFLAVAIMGPSSAAAQPPIGSTRQAIVYGADDRLDYYETPSPLLKDIARRSVVAMIPARALTPVGDQFGVRARALGDQTFCTRDDECFPLCEEEPFLEQPSAGVCSGVLIAEDLVLTAGHCFANLANDCSDYSYVFDYRYESEDELARIDADDVFGCAEMVLWELESESEEQGRDYAVIRLDRPVGLDRMPVEVRDTPLRDGDTVNVIGFPIGLPVKIDMGGLVQVSRAKSFDFFTATTDTFVGNSGSGLFDAEGRLTGHLVLGGDDFEKDPIRSCLRTVVVPDNEVPFLYEHAVYTKGWREALCEKRIGTEALCASLDGSDDGCAVQRRGGSNTGLAGWLLAVVTLLLSRAWRRRSALG